MGEKGEGGSAFHAKGLKMDIIIRFVPKPNVSKGNLVRLKTER